MNSKYYITKDKMTVNFKGYNVEIPKGTRCSNRTALGADDNYIFVSELSFLPENSFERHDATYYGIRLQPEQVREVVKFLDNGFFICKTGNIYSLHVDIKPIVNNLPEKHVMFDRLFTNEKELIEHYKKEVRI